MKNKWQNLKTAAELQVCYTTASFPDYYKPHS